ncbi:VanW family protein [Desulfoscipio sp. XC116]|uniref:VanW family protein n=1 Tax=Desulfoscipio sp. XC116 TaxID=3144975 RepID=UPI00325ABA6E
MRQAGIIIILVAVLLGVPPIYRCCTTAMKDAALIPADFSALWVTAAKTYLYGEANLGNKDIRLELGGYGESQAGSEDYNIFKKFSGMERSYEGPLPWEKDPQFLSAIKKYNTPVLMAAYKASLPDPIKAEGYNIGLAAEQLAGQVVQPGEIFSQNKSIGPYTEYRGYQAGPTYAGNQLVTTVGGGVCKIASMLYNVVTFSDLKVIMRDSHSMTVPYVPPGQDATVYYGARDFRFMNNTQGPVVIWSQKVDCTLYMALYGCQKPPKVTWHHVIKKRIKYWTEYRYNPNLPPGGEKVTAPGQDGYVVRSWVTVETPDGMVTSKKKGTSWYNASPRVIERGPRKPQ